MEESDRGGRRVTAPWDKEEEEERRQEERTADEFSETRRGNLTAIDILLITCYLWRGRWRPRSAR